MEFASIFPIETVAITLFSVILESPCFSPGVPRIISLSMSFTNTDTEPSLLSLPTEAAFCFAVFTTSALFVGTLVSRTVTSIGRLVRCGELFQLAVQVLQLGLQLVQLSRVGDVVGEPLLLDGVAGQLHQFLCKLRAGDGEVRVAVGMQNFLLTFARSCAIIELRDILAINFGD